MIDCLKHEWIMGHVNILLHTHIYTEEIKSMKRKWSIYVFTYYWKHEYTEMMCQTALLHGQRQSWIFCRINNEW